MRGMLLEREEELATAAALLDMAGSGDGDVLLVEGVAGIGKTVLLGAVGEEAVRRGARVLRARGGEIERESAFAVVRQLLEPPLAAASQAQREELLTGSAGLARAVLERDQPRPTATPSFAMLHGLYWLTVNLSLQAPLVVMVDDVHWCDPASARFLGYLAPRVEGLALLVVLAGRPGEPKSELRLLDELAGRARVLDPTPLSEQAVAILVHERLGVVPDRAFAEACHRATGGNPFLADELCATLAADGVKPTEANSGQVLKLGPRTVTRSLLLRISRLPRVSAAVAKAVATLGANAHQRHVAALAGLSTEETAQAADALCAIEILRPGTPLAFAHPILREAIYADIPPGERSTAHRRAAALLAADDGDTDLIAAHLLRVEPAADTWTTEALRRASSEALSHGATENAVTYLKRALHEGGADNEARARMLYDLGTAERAIAQPAAAGHLQEAIELSNDPSLRARASADLAELAYLGGSWTQAIELVEDALAGLPETSSAERMRLLTLAAATSSYDARLVARFDNRRQAYEALASSGSPGGRGMALLLAANAVQRGAPRETVLELVARGLDHGRFLADQGPEAAELAQAPMALIWTEELDRAAELCERAITAARARGSVAGFVVNVGGRAAVLGRRGALADAEAGLREATDLALQHGIHQWLFVSFLYGQDALMERPQLADITALIEQLELPAELEPTLTGAVLAAARGSFAIQRGAVEEGIDALRVCHATQQALGFRNPNAFDVRPALALALAGRAPEEAHVLAVAALEDATQVGLPRGIGGTLRTVGMIEGGEQGIRRLQEAVAVLERSPARLEHARALVELGAALRRTNQRQAARAPLRGGLELAYRCQATRLLERARSELAATGARPRRYVLSGAESLTPSERRVAELAAQGRSNPQIAQDLFVTVNTVETHLRRTYRKLDIRSRDQLPVALTRSHGESQSAAPR